jgi:hypothetical protein
MAKATMTTREEIIQRNKATYAKAKKKAKGEILDHVCQSTGLSRDRAKRLLSGTTPKHPRKRKPGRTPKYDKEFISVLEKIWMYMDFACGKRLAAGMEDMLDALIACGELTVGEDMKIKLQSVSASTADRLLARARKGLTLKGKSTTKPGTLLKKNIPVRMGNEWDDAIPGFVEIDLVAHCGTTTAGDYVNTLSVTDICSGWTETAAVINKAQKHVFEALMTIKERQPFPLLGIDSDNGSEFINAHLLRYCKQENICFTRSRPDRKNDGCHVEQKNWSVVRRNIGYDRYEGAEALKIMNEYYELLRLYMNFFLPSAKLLSKSRDGSKIRKHYEPPQTPYKRLKFSQHIGEDAKRRLEETWSTLNPAELKRGMVKLLEQLQRLRTTC